MVGSSRDTFSTPGGPSGSSIGRCYACGQATYATLPLGPSGATVAPTPLVPCPSVGGFLPVSSSPPAPPVAVSTLCFNSAMTEPEIKMVTWNDSCSASYETPLKVNNY